MGAPRCSDELTLEGIRSGAASTGARWALVPGGRYDHVGDPLIRE